MSIVEITLALLAGLAGLTYVLASVAAWLASYPAAEAITSAMARAERQSVPTIIGRPVKRQSTPRLGQVIAIVKRQSAEALPLATYPALTLVASQRQRPALASATYERPALAIVRTYASAKAAPARDARGRFTKAAGHVPTASASAPRPARQKKAPARDDKGRFRRVG